MRKKFFVISGDGTVVTYTTFKQGYEVTVQRVSANWEETFHFGEEDISYIYGREEKKELILPHDAIFALPALFHILNRAYGGTGIWGPEHIIEADECTTLFKEGK